MKVLRDADPRLKAQGVTVIGVSTDPVAKQRAFCRKYELPFDLLSDADGAISRAFGVPVDANGKAARETFMFRGGEMIWHDPSPNPARQAIDVFQVIEEVEAGTAVAGS